ncbi:HNH endonuclease [Modestobacter sp. VKM Ac-2985]|uniref:HNH endonuclease n=1 Tax=Modestobacter sp. VKM Ac-2985 TaxID=3004139 RepID=UPI0022AB5E78|nr:hypothetical protein [Modestobacter sp. VKM Ac-2985]MCZ2837154.1 hypothetical protein [Modestobacter sp. VKM Ac-2985]
MAWLRVGDTLASDPRVLVLHDPKNPHIAPACVGFLTLLGTLSTQNGTDYVIHPGFLHLAGGAAAPDLLKRCIRAGLITFLGGTGMKRRWKLIDDAPELIHIRLKDEIAWEKQQKSDTQKKDHLVPVLLRDGDACRWCGIPVQPMDTRSSRGRTIDHLRPGLAARGPHDLVVACRGCNSTRGADRERTKDDETPDAFAARWAPQLRPVPDRLLFVRTDVNLIEGAGHTIPAGSTIVDRAYPARDTPGTTTQTPGPDATHHATQARVAAPGRNTTSTDQHPAPAGVAATDAASTTPARPGSQPGAAHPAADQHPATPAGVAATADSTTAPECTPHPAPAGVAHASESRTNHSTTDRSRAGGPGRVGAGSGREGSPTPRSSPGIPPDPPPPPASTTPPRRTRRGKRRPRSA